MPIENALEMMRFPLPASIEGAWAKSVRPAIAGSGGIGKGIFQSPAGLAPLTEKSVGSHSRWQPVDCGKISPRWKGSGRAPSADRLAPKPRL